LRHGDAALKLNLLHFREPAAISNGQLAIGNSRVAHSFSLLTPAAKYFITLDTVRSHIKNIYCKMQVHNQLEAVARARNEGIVS
jgi:hypothetical protein